jgi:enediyne biosynthesis protein E4
VDGRRQAQAVLSQSSYYSHDDVRLHFGLGTARSAERVEVRWPSGGVDVAKDVAPNQVLTVREGSAAVNGAAP